MRNVGYDTLKFSHDQDKNACQYIKNKKTSQINEKLHPA